MRILYRYMAPPFVDGESKRERRSLPFAAFDLDDGAVLLQDLVGDGESQPRPLGFGCEEGVEDLREIILRNPDAAVADGDTELPARFLRILLDVALHPDGAALRHGLHGVEQDVDEDL